MTEFKKVTDAVTLLCTVSRDGEFTRKQLMDILLPNTSASLRKLACGTYDNYRNWLTQAGYIKKIGRGIYMFEKPIPEDLTSREVRRQGYKTETWWETQRGNKNGF